MGALVGLGFGLGLLLVWSAFLAPAPRPASRGPGRLGVLLAEAGLREVSVRALLLVCAGCGLLAGVLALGVTRTATLAAVLGVLAACLPLAVVHGRARRRRRELAEVWPEAVDDLASAVRAGMSLPDAVAALAVRGPDALRPAFAAFALDYQVSGRFGDCLDRLKERLADPVGDRVVEGLRVAREVGGGHPPPSTGRRLSRSASPPPGTTPSTRRAGYLVSSSRVTCTRRSRSTSACWSRSKCGRLVRACSASRVSAETRDCSAFSIERCCSIVAR